MQKVLLLLSIIFLFSCTTSEVTKMIDQPILEDPGDQPGAAFMGNWMGDLNVGAIKLRIVFRVLLEEGEVKAYMDSPDQGAFGIPVMEIIPEEGGVTFKIAAVAGFYTGTLTDEGTLEGSWTQAGENYPLNLVRQQEEISYIRPQDPVEPYPYKVMEVKFENPGAGITLGGTLTYPESGAAEKGVILISGSGAQNRDEEIMGHRPFWVLADYFSRRGIAALRFDDRGVGDSGGDHGSATSVDFSSDVEAAVDFLINQEYVTLSAIGLVGHSEGGLIAPMTASQNSHVDFIILMAGPGFPGEEILYQQTELILRAMETSEEDIALGLERARTMYDIVKKNGDSEAAREEIKNLLIDEGTPELRAEASAAVLTSPWYRFFLTYDPRPALAQLTIPVLAINGSLDLQVPAKENLASIEATLKAAGNSRYTIKEFPGLNHLFQTAETGLMSEYSRIEETFSPGVLTFMVDWILGL